VSAYISERYFVERSYLNDALASWEKTLQPVASKVDAGGIVSGRVKSHRSVMGKVYRVANRPRTWESIGDLVALKVIFPTERGVTEFSGWLNSQTQWSPKLDEKVGEPDELKYRSKQFDLVSDSNFDSTGEPICVEVQVRTAVADAWYVVDHRLRYKGMVALPAGLERKLLRLTVLTELFDEEVEAVIAKQVELPEYAVARVYEQITREYDELVNGFAKTSRPEALLECLMQSYTEEEMPGLLVRLHEFVVSHGEAVRSVVTDHLHGSPNFVEHRDWLYYEPESLIVAERSLNKPALLRSATNNSDFDFVLGPMMVEFQRGFTA
jgi:ppGpp synthetase/RelA/SpoT-type nucleotidyltranferase